MRTSRLKRELMLLMVLFLCSCRQKQSPIKVIHYEDLKGIIEDPSSERLVLNFWATWCAPCVKELPQFEALNEKYKDEGLRVVLVSFDFVEELEGKVSAFVKKKNLRSEVLLLDETDYNAFVDKVDTAWSGAIPATLMIDKSKGKRVFFEKEFKQEELLEAYKKFVQ